MEHVTPIISLLSACLGAIATAYGVFKWAPKLWANAKLIAENAALREENKRLREALQAALDTTEAWESRVRQIEDAFENRIEQVQVELADAVIYIATLVATLRDGKHDIPPIPDRLKDLITRALTKGDPIARRASENDAHE